MDKAEEAVAEFRRVNSGRLREPFSQVVRKHGNHLDPIEVAPRLRNRRQESKK